MFWIRTTKTPQKLLIIFCYFFSLFYMYLNILKHAHHWAHLWYPSNNQVTFYHLFLYIPISMLFIFYLLKIVNIQNTFCNLNTSYRWFHLYLLLHHRCACNTWSFNQKQKAKKKWTVKIILKQRIGDSDLLNCRLLEPTHLFLCQ